MRRRKGRLVTVGVAVLAPPVAAALLWLSLTHKPDFYRKLVQTEPSPQRHESAQRFLARSAQLRNDIMNEPHWEAAFSDHQVNAWLAEDLVNHFADQIPPGVHEPRVSFELDRMIFAFELDQGPVRSVITVVARVDVPEGNVVALTLEKIRAGVLPVPADQLLGPITQHAESRGLVIHWKRDWAGLPVALLGYRADARRRDIVLEKLQLLNGQIRLSGRSDRHSGTAAALSLPSRRVLQLKFPRRKVQESKDPRAVRVSARRSVTVPLNVAPSRSTTTESSLHRRTA
jgi:hypothetical protein